MIPGPFAAWMQELGAEGKLADESYVPFAMRGFAWKMSVALVGDFTGYQLIGRVKSAPDAATNLAVMTEFGPVPFEGRTLWEMSLPGVGANSTSSFPADSYGDAVQKFPFLLILVPPAGASPYPLIGGTFTLLGAL